MGFLDFFRERYLKKNNNMQNRYLFFTATTFMDPLNAFFILFSLA